MQGILKKSEAGWYVLAKSHQNVFFGEPVRVRYLLKSQNHNKLWKIEDKKVNFTLEGDLAVLDEPDEPELVYCYCGRTVRCDCSRSK